MALVQLPSPWLLTSRAPYQNTTAATTNAAGESGGVVGRVRLAGGSGSKTISSAGGAIIHALGSTTVTFANAGTNVRVGIQDVDPATGLEDGTFDVYADLVGGTDTLTASLWRNTAMETGTKTIAHGDLVAVVVEMTARGGTDAFGVARYFTDPTSSAFPYGTADGGSLVKSNTESVVLLKFDDGTYGWIDLLAPITSPLNAITLQAVDSTASPDEYAAIFKLPLTVAFDAAGAWLGGIAAGETFEFVLYSDPLGTPVAIESVPVDPDVLVTTADLVLTKFASTILQANTYYGLAIRPTTSGSINYGYFNLGSGFDMLKITQPFGEIKMGARTDQTGPFVETQAYHLPALWLNIVQLDNGLGIAEASAQIGVM